MEFNLKDFEMVKRWSASDIRGLCVEKNWYTCGDCSAYEEMLGFVYNNEPTKENIFKVAVDIFNHSDVATIQACCGYSEKELLTSILFEIERKTYTYWEEKED